MKNEELLDSAENGANIDAKGGFKNKTALHFATWNGHTKIVELLLKHGAYVDVADSNDLMPLHLAAWNGHLDVVKLLIEKGLYVDVADSNDFTPLHAATRNGHLDVVKLLIEKGAYVNAADSNRRTPFLQAAQQGHLDVVEFFLVRDINNIISVVKWKKENDSINIDMYSTCLIIKKLESYKKYENLLTKKYDKPSVNIKINNLIEAKYNQEWESVKTQSNAETFNKPSTLKTNSLNL